jgi:5,5'-dehydrodivanillate O-demethylase
LGDLHLEKRIRQIVFSELSCNWLQSPKNSIDPVHLEWLHNNWSKRLHDEHDVYAPTHVKIDFDEFDQGFG